MQGTQSGRGPIMRLFQVRARKGCVEDLLRKFDTTSADVVRDEPGNEGYFFGDSVSAEDDVVVFASFWTDLEAVKTRFGADWEESFLPPGYAELIEEHTLLHIDVGAGWHVRLDRS